MVLSSSIAMAKVVPQWSGHVAQSSLPSEQERKGLLDTTRDSTGHERDVFKTGHT